MRPIDEQTILITGSTDGLGRALARDLAARGARVLVHGRSEERLRETAHEIGEAAGGERPRTYRADFASLDEVRRLANEVERDHERLDALVNNAGIGAGRRPGRREESADGHELRFAVNYLSHFLLTNLLLPRLRRSAPARIVNVASAAQDAIAFDDPMLERGYDGMRAYAQSKLALVLFTFELADRLRGEGAEVTVNALHPASLMDTKMVREWFGRAMTSVEEGVEATRRLVIAPELDGVRGRYFDGLREARAHRQAYDEEARRRLWHLSERWTGLDGPATGSAAPSRRG